MICRRSEIGDGAGKGECCENAPLGSRARLRDGRDGQWSRFSELRAANVELRIAPFSHGSHFTRHGLSRTVSASLLVMEVILSMKGL